MAVMKRLIIVLLLVSMPLIIGLLFTYEIIKIDWISFMEIQPVSQPQRDPLPMPARSVPIQGTSLNPFLGVPTNPYPANEASIARGQYFYNISCTPCHGAQGQGNGPFSAFLREIRPSDLTAEDTVNMSDGEIFIIISNGIEGAMPAMRYNLPDEEMRWTVVNYVRSLQQGSQ
jgi:mono/diheme cytochrome c family protein